MRPWIQVLKDIKRLGVLSQFEELLSKEESTFEDIAKSELAISIAFIRSERFADDAELKSRMLADIRHLSLILPFIRDGRNILKPSAALIEMLSQTKVTLPIRDVRPPYPTLYVEFEKPVMVDEEEQYAYGMYCSIFNDDSGGEFQAIVAMSPPSIDKTTAIGYLDYCTFTWNTKEDGDAEDVFFSKKFSTPKGELAPTTASNLYMFRLACNLFLYMSCPDSEVDSVVGYKAKEWKKVKDNPDHFKHGKLKEDMLSGLIVEEHYVGRTVTLVREKSAAGESKDSGASKQTHWRRGHWHRYWIGARDSDDRQLVPKWLKPVLVAGEGEAKAETTYEIK